MVIQEIIFHNFRSYYGDCAFEFNDGLNIIVGDNGDGKTTFFEGLEWLFDPYEDKSIDHASAMMVSELNIGDSETVSVTMNFDHDGSKSLTKSFRVEKTEKGVVTKDFSFVGLEENDFERIKVNGKSLVDRCFDAYMRKYSLFKGEKDLDVLNSPQAMSDLVNNFSDIKSFKKQVEVVTELEKKAHKAYIQESKNDTKVSGDAERLEKEIVRVEGEIFDLNKDLDKQKKAKDDYLQKVNDLEKYQEASEQYQELKKRLENLNEKRLTIRRRINVNFNTCLLDKEWILCLFPDIYKEMQVKVSAFSKQKRTENDTYIAEQAVKRGKQEVIDEINSTILGGNTPLPWYLPDAQTMQEMIDDECCKVCGRKAEKGTDAYEFMVHKLADYMAHVQAESAQRKKEKVEEVPLFKFEHTEELQSLSITLGGSNAKKVNNIKNEILDCIEFVEARRKELAGIEAEIQEINDEKSRLLIQNGNVSEDLLDKSFSDISGLFSQLNRTDKRIFEIKTDLDKAISKKKELSKDLKDLNPGNYQVKLYKRVHSAFEQIRDAFARSKENHFTAFVQDIENTANYFFEQLNGEDFRGIIRLKRKADSDTADIKLYSKDNQTIIKKPNTALVTTMYMSVLFAIAKMTSDKRESRHPLIFDAPTSSFGDFKEDFFYGTIGKISSTQEQQCIIVTKDLLVVDKSTGKKRLDYETIERLGAKTRVTQIEKAPGFDQTDLSTVRTIIKK